ncbi:hypothetical protein yc1106_08366 [Curvularia clavata]|uniref:Uncharacterized protein n=1 Tax=Curvularia clavata TaxID=95742 RepID=A0A9Q8ZFL4_CURCL|nr:hypothetical protein yc1106_08366 [Curvularia clavata]
MVLHHLLTGSYTNSSLYLLAFDALAQTLTLNTTIPGFGLHQFVSANAARDVIYATTMSEPPRLFSWSRTPDNKITHINTVNIRGSGARINKIDEDGGVGETVQEMFYVPSEEMERVDRTRKAVLYGAHGFDVNGNGKGFVPHLAWDAIFMYDIIKNGTAKLLSVNLSPETGDGPRNVYPSKDGKWLYVINEHSQYLDVYEINETNLKHRQRASAIPNQYRGKYTYRSNAVQLSRDGTTLFTSTRSWNNTQANGWVAAFALDAQGKLASTDALTYYEAPLSLSSAGGLRVAHWQEEGVSDYMYLSDTQEGWMYVLSWVKETAKLEEMARLRYPDGAAPYEAVWLD